PRPRPATSASLGIALQCSSRVTWTLLANGCRHIRKHAPQFWIGYLRLKNAFREEGSPRLVSLNCGPRSSDSIHFLSTLGACVTIQNTEVWFDTSSVATPRFVGACAGN